MLPVGSRPLPDPYDQVPELKGFQAGYRCSIVGVFWMYATWWDCKPVAVNTDADSYIDDAELVAAIGAKYTEKDIQAGFWKGTMRWVLLGIVLLMVALIAWGAITGDGDQTESADGKPSADRDDEARPDTGGA